MQLSKLSGRKNKKARQLLLSGLLKSDSRFSRIYWRPSTGLRARKLIVKSAQ
jgi:hypothetical protein